MASSQEDSFEGKQLRLAEAVQRASRSLAVPSRDQADLTSALRKQFPGAYQCGSCGFGPVDHAACADLRRHHGEKTAHGVISNACPKCGWFSEKIAEWPAWDGNVHS